MTFPVTLTIAGSDSGGGAGIQADLRVMQRIGTFGTSAITAVTAQNLDGVRDVDGVRPQLLGAQIDAVLEGFPVAAIKTGMLWSAALVEVVIDRLHATDAALVVDPVMVATSGARLLNEDAVAAYAGLFSRALVATPNLDEGEALLERAIDRGRLAEEAARLADRLGCAVLLKGGHLAGAPIDVLVTASETHAWTHPRITHANTHGSGCMLSSAIAAYLALGHGLPQACLHALAFVHDALARGGAHGLKALAHVEAATADLSVLEPVVTRG